MTQNNNEELAIGVISDRSGLAVSTIRFYEDRGLITSKRTDGGQRRYHREVLRRLGFIQAAQRVGLTLEQIKEALNSLPTDHGPNAQDWRRLSTTWKPVLDEKIRILEALRDQLDSCIGCGCLSLERCALSNPGDRAARFGPGPRYLLGSEHPPKNPESSSSKKTSRR